MADWSALTRGFQEGRASSDKHRASQQLEEYMGRDLNALSGAEGDLLSAFPDETAGIDPFAMEDPMGMKLIKKLMGKFGKKKQQALPLAAPGDDQVPVVSSEIAAEAPTADFTAEDPELYAGGGYADGGAVGHYKDGGLTVEDLERLNRKQLRNAKVEIAKDAIKGGARKALDVGREAVKYKGVRPAGAGALSSAAGAGAAVAGIKGALDAGGTDTEDYYTRFGMNSGDDDSTLDKIINVGSQLLPGGAIPTAETRRGIKDTVVRTGGALTDVGAAALDILPGENLARSRFPDKIAQGGVQLADSVAAGRAAPAEGTPENPMKLSPTTIRGPGRGGAAAGGEQVVSDAVNFADLDVDPSEVPDMKTDEWKQYRRMIIRDAARRGQPIDQVNDRITQMQQKNFVNYGQQGLALQQAGNPRAAMAAYRAAFQYFPNGNDVEFGTQRNPKTGVAQIIGFGKDEKTGKVVPGTELIMEPERVAVLLENFQKPEAFRMWTKDWRDFQQELRKYEEVDKPQAQAQADAAATNAQANLNTSVANLGRANALGAGGGMKQSDVRASQEMFANLFMEGGVEDQAEAMQLADFAIQLKQRQPQLAETTITRMVLQRAGMIQ